MNASVDRRRAVTGAGFVDVDGGRLYYEVDGAGRAVMLIHGGLGSLRMWDELVPALAGQFRVIRFDTRGYGRSETADVAFSNRADAVAVLDHLGESSCALVGQSRGGIIALDLAIERPSLVDALVIAAGGASGLEPTLAQGVAPAPWDELERAYQAADWPALAELETRVWVDGWGQPSTRVDVELRRRVHGWILDSYRQQKAEGRPKPLDPPAAGRLGEVAAPTLVVVGTADEPGSVVAGRHLAQNIPAARLVEFEGVAHMVQLEQPERFNQLVLDFLLEQLAHQAG